MEPLLAIAGATLPLGGLGLLWWRFGDRLRWVVRVGRYRRADHDPGAVLAPVRGDLAARLAAAPALDPATAWSVALQERSDERAVAALACFLASDDAAGALAVGLCLGHVEGTPWRAFVRTLPVPQGDDHRSVALRAERAAALGLLDEARLLVDQLPADHWRACRVRGLLYALSGDLERAASARHAAWQLAPEEAREALARQLEPTRLGVR
jgi:hypothetical protein